MNTKTQTGHIFRKSGRWYLRYYDSVLRDGVLVRAQLCKRLCDYDDEHRNVKSVKALAADILQPINSGKVDARSTMTVVAFIEDVYLPEVKETKRASTTKNYKDVFRLHVKARLGKTSLRDFRTVDGEQLLKNIVRQARTKSGAPLTHNSLSRIKSFLSGVFTTARRLGALDTINPMMNVSVPAGNRSTPTHAYSTVEITAMLAALPEPARTVVLLAAYTGLRQGEIRGLRWCDYDGKTLLVRRSVWRKGVINEPKTASAAAPVPVVEILQAALERHRLRVGDFAIPNLPIFQADNQQPMNLANMANRVIIPKIEKCVKCRKPEFEHKTDGHLFELDQALRWHGWHAFRRGLATNLHALHVADRDIQAILRHSNIAVTQASYIKSVSEVQIDALERMAKKATESRIQ